MLINNSKLVIRHICTFTNSIIIIIITIILVLIILIAIHVLLFPYSMFRTVITFLVYAVMAQASKT